MFAVNLTPGSSLANLTGSWRSDVPEYQTLTPPCQTACLAGEPVREWVVAAQNAGAEDHAAGLAAARHAWELIVSRNPLPATMGRICYASCERSCNRHDLGGSMSIRSLESLLGDLALQQGWPLPSPAPDTGKHVLVVGSGPCGLAAMYHLRRAGHTVTVREFRPVPGGTLNSSISDSRLPKEILHGEINRILDLGIEFLPSNSVRHVDSVMDDYDGVVWAVGASMCMAIVHNNIIWRQPVHTEGRLRRTSTLSLGRGFAAASALSEYLTNETPKDTTPELPLTASVNDLNTWYYPADTPRLDPAIDNTDSGRSSSTPFDSPPVSLAQISAEALRCMSCGNCFNCDVCYVVCPDNTIIKNGTKYTINTDYCKGCGICVEECPAGAMDMHIESY